MDEETRERGTRETASTKPTELIQDAGFRSTPPGLSGESKPSLKRGGWRSFTKGPSISMDSLMESFEKMHLIDVPRHPRVIAKPISQIMRMSGAARDAHAKYRLSLVPNSAIVKLPDPLEGIVFHYEKFSALSSGQTCEAAYLCSLGISVQILVSLSSLHHMEKAYGSIFGLPANVEKPVVKPLFFTEKQLMLKRVKTFLAAGEGAMPVYMEVVCKILEKMALEKKRAAGSDYAAFKARIASEVLDEQQSRSLNTRLDLLERFVGLRNDPVTAKNAAKTTKRVRIDTGESSVDDEDIWSFRPGSLTIVDLRCPHVDEDVACSLFNLCLPLFLENRGESCCIVALDEAQKFLTGTVAASILTESLLQVIRQQQNLEIIATQEPSISPQLLDLSSMTIVHRFTSISWLKELKQHFAGFSSFEGPSSENLLDIAALISDLKESEALLFCLSDMLDTENEERFGGIVKKVRKLRSRYFVHHAVGIIKRHTGLAGGAHIILLKTRYCPNSTTGAHQKNHAGTVVVQDSTITRGLNRRMSAMALLQTPPLEAMSNTNPPQPTPPQPDPSTSPQPDPSTSIFSPRSGKQFSIFVAGAAFFGFSAFITRRALTRRYKASIPRFYQPSNQPSTRVNGAMEAFEALNIATINVASVAIMMTGGLLWAYDISTLEELRRKLRGGMGWDVSAKDAEEEFEEWLATTLARKEEKQRRKGEEGEWRDTNERGRPR